MGDDSDDIPEPQSAGELLNLIVNRENSFVHRDSGSSGGEEKKKKKLMLKGEGLSRFFGTEKNEILIRKFWGTLEGPEGFISVF